MKKIFAVIVSAVMLVCLAGCSGNYVMTEEDIAVQKSIEGRWLADDSTGYNSYDGNGNFLLLTAIEFTSDYKYLVYECMPGDDQASGYVRTYPPTAYSFEDKMFKVDVDGVASYARVSVSEDGQTLYWITDDQTDKYNRLTDEQTAILGIPAYDPVAWKEMEANSEGGDVTEPEAGDVTESETGIVSENTAEGSAADVESNSKGYKKPYTKVLDIDTSDFEFDRSITLNEVHGDYDKTPVLLWKSEDGEIAVYGMYLYNKEPYIFIEHDGVIDAFYQDWLTPRRIEPCFMYSDIDGDGEKELAAVYYVGSGTGISVEWLVVYELEDGHFVPYVFDDDDVQANAAVEITVDNDTKTAEYAINVETYSSSFDNGIVTGYYKDGVTAEDMGFGERISYELDENKITFTASPGCLTVYVGPTVTAEVTYKDGKFTLTNFEFAEEE